MGIKSQWLKLAIIPATIFLMVAVVLLLPKSAPLSGQLRTADGHAQEDGYYDMRLVGYNARTGALEIQEDYADVDVRGGSYVIKIPISSFAETGSVVYQVCHSEKGSDVKDGLDNADTLAGCRVPVERGKSFEVASCPQQYTVSRSSLWITRILGERFISVDGSCLDAETASAFDFAESAIPSPSIIGLADISETDGGTEGPVGAQGPQGERGLRGLAGPAGADGSGVSSPQTLSIFGDVISLLDGGDVDLSKYLDNSDNQQIDLNTNILTLKNGTGLDTQVDLSSYLDNSDQLASLSCLATEIAKYDGSNWACAADDDTQLTELEVDAFVANNGFLSAEVDGSTTNELNNTLVIVGNELRLTDAAGTLTADLSSYLDNTDTLDDLSCAAGEVAQWNGASSVWQCAAVGGVDTDDQTLTWTAATQTLEIADGNSVILSSLLDNTDNQDLSLSGSTLSLTNDGTTVDLSGLLDNTDAQTIALSGNTITLGNGTAADTTVDLAAYLDDTTIADDQTLTWTLGTTTLEIADGNTVDLAGLLDNTDAQAISLTGDTLAITGNAGTVDLSAYLDNTDTQLTETEVDAFVANNGYLTSFTEVDGSITNEIQDLSLSGSILSLSGDGTTVDLSAFTNTDAQTIGFNTGTNILTISGGNTADLSSLVNTDVLGGLSCGANEVAKFIASSWTCAVDIDTDTNTQLDETAVDGFVSNNGYLTTEVDGSTTNEIQDLSLSGDTLSLTSDGTTVDLSTYLDNTDVLAGLSCGSGQFAQWNGSAWICITPTNTNTDAQSISLSGNTITLGNGTGLDTTVDLSAYLDDTTIADDQTLTWTSGTTILEIADGNTVNLSALLDNTDELASLSCSANQIAKFIASAWTCANDVDTDTDAQDLSLSGSTLSLTNDGTTVDLSPFLDNTDTQLTETEVDAFVANNGYLTSFTEVDGSITNEIQDLSLSGSILSLSGDGTTVDLSAFTNTDTQDLSLASDILSLVDGGSVSLAAYLDNTDNQDLSLSGSTLSLTNDGTTVDLSGLLDNTDAQTIALSGNTITLGNGTAADTTVDLAAYLDDTTIADDQTLTWTLGTTTLEIADGNTVDLAGLLDNTDAQAISLTGDTLAITGNAGTVDLSAYLDNTDTQLTETEVDAFVANNGYLTSFTEVDGSITNEIQDLSLSGSILSLSGDGTTVDLSAFTNTDAQTIGFNTGTNILTISGGNTADLSSLVNTDVLGGLSCGANEVAKFIASSWTCAVDIDTDTNTQLDETAVDGFVSNNGYLTTEVDGSTTNEIQDLSLSGDTLSLTSDGTTVDLSTYLDNTDVLAGLSCGSGQFAQWNGSAWICITPTNTNTDAQSISLSGNTITLGNGTGLDTTVDLSAYLDDTTIADDQTLTWTSGTTILEIADGNTVNLSALLDNTDELASLSCSANQIAKFIASAWTCANDVDTDTDAQDLSLSGSTLSLTNDGTTVDLSPFLDNTDTQLTETEVDAFVANNGYLTSFTEVDGSITNEIQDLSLSGSILSLSGDGTTVDLSAFTNTDTQDLSLASDILSLVDGGSVSLAAYLDNTDNQDLSLSGSTLSLTNDGTTVDLSGLLDNTDAQTIALSGNTITLGNGTAADTTVDLAAYLDDTTIADDQTLTWTLGTTTLEIADGNTVDLAGLLDNTDAQAISLTGDTLAITGNAGTVDLSAYLDNTDTQLTETEVDAFVANNGYLTSFTEVDGSITNEIQDLSLSGSILSLSGDGTTVDLSAFTNTDAQTIGFNTGTNILTISGGNTADLSSLVNTDVLGGLSCGANEVAKFIASSWTCAVDIDTDTNTQLDETAVDGFVSNNGYLTTEVDGSTTNEIQDLSLSGDTLSLTSDGTTVDLSTYLDNTDVLAGLSCGSGQFAQWNGSAWICITPTNTNTDAQSISLSGNTITLGNGTGLDTTVDLSAYLDDTTIADDQTLTWTSGTTILEIADGNTVNLSALLDNTDELASLSCSANQIAKFIASAWTCANDVDTDTDAQDLSLSGSTLSLTNDGTTVDLSPFLDNTDTQLTETEVDAFVANNGYLTSFTEVDGSITNEIQDLSLSGSILSLSGDGTTVDLSAFTNTDTQDLSLASDILSLVDGGSVSLAAYLDNTDNQDLSLSGSTLSLTNDGTTVDLSGLLDNTDAQTIALSGNTITLGNGTAADTTVDLAAYLDDTTIADDQTLTWTLGTTTLEIADGNTVDLAGLLDNTDAQAISLTGDTLAITGNAGTVDLSAYLDNTDTQLTETEVDAFVANNGYLTSFTEVDGSITNEIQDLSLSGSILSLSGDGTTVDLSAFTNTDTQDLSLASDILSLVDGGSVSLAAYLDNTDNQDLSLSGSTLSLTNDGTTVDLSGLLDNTDAQTIALSGNTITLGNGTAADTTVDLAAYLDDTTIADDQTLTWTLGTTTLEIADGNTVDLAGLLDNTDAQAISLTGDTLAITGNAGTVDLSAYLDNTDTQLTETEVDAFVANNGYLTSFTEVDGSITNEIQDLSLSGSILSLSGDGTTVDLSAFTNTDTQDLSLASDILSLVDGGSVSLAAYLDNTDNQDLSLSGSTLSLTNDGTTVDLSGLLDNTDAQTIALSGNTITLGNGTAADTTVDLAAYLDDTTIADDQTLTWTLGTTTLEIADGNTVDLAGLLDNTDAQAISLTGDTLAITGNAGTVDLSAYLDNTDTQLTETEVDAFVANNGYLTSFTEVDGSITNEIQDLSLSGSILSLSGDGTTVDLSAFTNTDTQDLSLASDILSLVDGGSVSLAAYLDNTDNQDLSLSGSTLSLTNDGTTVDLSGLLDNTDAQTIALSGNTITLGNGTAADTTVDLAAYLDDTTIADDQTLTWTLGTTTLEIADGNTVDLAGLLDNTDAQDLSLSGSTLSLTNDGSTVDLSGFANTDAQAISLSSNIVSITGNASTIDLTAYIDTNLTEGEVDAFVSNNGYLTSFIEVDGSITNEIQDLSLTGSVLSLTGDGSTVNLSAFANTDAQVISLSGDTISITGSAGTVDLSGYANTDILAALSCSGGQVAQYDGANWVCANLVTGAGDIVYGQYVYDTQTGTDATAWTFTDPIGTGLQPNNTAGRWSHDTDGTTSVDVGPTSGQGGSPDGYVYTEASTSATLGDVFTMELNQDIDASAGDVLIELYTNQRGDENDATLDVQTNEAGAGWVTRASYGGPTDPNKVATAGADIWAQRNVDLTGIVSDPVTRVRFLVTLGLTGTVWHNDYGIDSVTVTLAASSGTVVDGIVGNEILDVGAGSGLVRTGAGTTGDPYVVSLRTDCSDGQVLAWVSGTSSWDCSTISGGASLPIAQFRDSAGGTEVNGAAAAAVPWATEDIKEAGITHSTTVNNSRAQLDAIGTYRITYSVSADKDTANVRAVVECRIRVNGVTTLDQGVSYSYNRNNANDSATNNATTLYTTTGVNDYIEIVCLRSGDAPSAVTIANESWITIEQIR